jgi:HTH-type transcriptional regulator / antitoxin MqsA
MVNQAELNMEICDICEASGFRQEKVSETFTINGTAVTVDNIPATVCVQCGDRTFSKESAEQLRQKLRSDMDAALIEMTSDPGYQAEAIQLETEFAMAPWDAFQLALTDEEKQELDQRIAEHDAAPDNVLTWEELKTSIKTKKQ